MAQQIAHERIPTPSVAVPIAYDQLQLDPHERKPLSTEKMCFGRLQCVCVCVC